jgi:hypothetical protein
MGHPALFRIEIRYDGRGPVTGKIEMKQTAIDLVASSGKTAGPSTAPFAMKPRKRSLRMTHLLKRSNISRLETHGQYATADPWECEGTALVLQKLR